MREYFTRSRASAVSSRDAGTMAFDVGHFVVTAIFLLMFDGVFLYFAVYKRFKEMVVEVQGSEPEIKRLPAGLVYFIIPFSLYTLIIEPGRPVEHAALLGFLVYSVYDLTNLATLKKWEWQFAMLDIAWGTVLFTIVTATVNAVFNLSDEAVAPVANSTNASALVTG